MLSMIFGFLAKYLTPQIIQGGVDAYKAKLAAGNTQDNIAASLAQRAAELDMQERAINAQIIANDNGSFFMRGPRGVTEWCFALLVCKIIVWDLILGFGTTIVLSGSWLDNNFKIIFAFWFGGRTIEKVATIVGNRFRK